MEISAVQKRYASAARRHFRMAAFACLGILLGGVVAFAVLGTTAPEAYENPVMTAAAHALPASEPIHLSIPSVEIEAEFEAPLGVQENGEIEVPESFDTVGWYRYGPTPGEVGPSVVLGHVDSKAGPEVFYTLRDLQAGDSVFIERKDGTTAEFEVVKVEQHPQDDFPTESVYSDLDYPGLRLITCSGVYDRGEARYTHNLIVYAKLKM